jgi:hypothetical protein
MSEMGVTLHFKVKSNDHERWRVLLEGLDRGELGAYLEERVEPFGQQAEDLLESLLDDSEGLFFEFKLLNQENVLAGADYSIQIMSNDVLSLCMPRIMELLNACGAEVLNKAVYQEE